MPQDMQSVLFTHGLRKAAIERAMADLDCIECGADSEVWVYRPNGFLQIMIKKGDWSRIPDWVDPEIHKP